MPMTPGLVPNLRQVFPSPEMEEAGPGVVVEIDEGQPKADRNDRGEILRIEHEDGSVTVSLDGKGIADEGQSEAEYA